MPAPPEAPLSRTDDRRNLLIALGAAGATLAVVLGIVGIPAIGACSADPRGVITCLRDMTDRKFDLPGTIPGQSAENAPVAITEHAEPTIVVDLPAPAVLPTTETAAIPPSAPRDPAVAETPEPVAIPEPPVDPAPIEPAPAAVELAAAPQAPTTPRAAPPAEAAPETALNWTVPLPTDLEPLPTGVEPLPVAPPATAPTQQASVASDPLPAPPAPDSQMSPSLPQPAPPDGAPPTSAAGAPIAPPATPPQEPELEIANTEPVEAGLPPATVAAPVALAPTIDAIELEGEASYVSGSGPAGALMRLYADGELIGESPVEEGRWLVEGSTLIDSPRKELRVEAIEPETGKLLGYTAITVEIELPAGGTPPDERPATPPEFGSSVAPPEIGSPEPARAQVPRLSALEPPTTGPLAPASKPVTADETKLPAGPPEPPAAELESPVAEPETPVSEPETPVSEPELQVAAPEPPVAASETRVAEPEIHVAEPRLAPELPAQPDTTLMPEPPIALPERGGQSIVAPQRESASVEFLKPVAPDPVAQPPVDVVDNEPAAIIPMRPDAPALIADLKVPAPAPLGEPATEAPGQPVTMLRLLPFGDPDSGRYNVGKAIIRRGDTLWSLARRYYGHGIHYRTIFHANRDLIRRASRIFPGQVFDLPLVTDD